jgi:hypothetical protein
MRWSSWGADEVALLCPDQQTVANDPGPVWSLMQQLVTRSKNASCYVTLTFLMVVALILLTDEIVVIICRVKPPSMDEPDNCAAGLTIKGSPS